MILYLFPLPFANFTKIKIKKKFKPPINNLFQSKKKKFFFILFFFPS